MFLIALRNLLQEKIRLLISVGGVTFSIILMLTMMGIYEGSVFQFTRYIQENPTHLVIAKEGIIDFFHGISLISTTDLENIKKEPSVTEVVPMIAQRATLDYEGKKYHVFLASFIPEKPQGAPWELTQGNKNISEGEIIISEILAKKTGKKIDDTIDLSDKTFRIKGLAADASSFSTNYAWITFEQAKNMTKLPDTVNFAFVNVDDPNNAISIASDLSVKYTQLSVLDKSTFIANNRAELEESYLPIIQAIMIISILIGITVVGLTIYTATIEKSKEYGILKAIGINNKQLYAVVAVQALSTTVLGLMTGIAASLLLAQGLESWVNLPPHIQTPQIVYVIVAGVGIALVSSLLPLRKLLHIDPAEVFKA